jgi:hypothetical protein
MEFGGSFPKPVAGITRKGKWKGSACYRLGCSMEVHVSTEIIQVFHGIFKACIERNFWDFELLGKTNVGHILCKWRGSLLQKIFDRGSFSLIIPLDSSGQNIASLF